LKPVVLPPKRPGFFWGIGPPRAGIWVCCHAPIDNILLEKLKKYDFPALKCAWSRLDDYTEYLQWQNWLRQKFLMPRWV
jgi:hypothetical protein